MLLRGFVLSYVQAPSPIRSVYTQTSASKPDTSKERYRRRILPPDKENARYFQARPPIRQRQAHNPVFRKNCCGPCRFAWKIRHIHFFSCEITSPKIIIPDYHIMNFIDRQCLSFIQKCRPVCGAAFHRFLFYFCFFCRRTSRIGFSFVFLICFYGEEVSFSGFQFRFGKAGFFKVL